MRFIVDNYLLDSTVSITASSANASYPVTNLSHQFRSKMWRSSGNFTVTAANNKINFKESAIGAELTATITVGSYTATTLAAEIKTQLEAVGAETYTISYSTTTGKWTISHAGAYLDLLNNTGTNQATSLLKSACGFADSDRAGAVSYVGPKVSIHTEEYILIDLMTSEEINSAVLLWSKDTGITLSSGAVVKLQASATNNWTNPPVNETLTIDNTYSLYSHYFTTTKEYRYWRIVIQDQTNVNLYVDLGVVILGMAETVDTADRGFVFSTQDTSIVTRTAFGNEFVDEYPMVSSLKIALSVLDYADAVIIEQAYKRNGVRKPVYIALDETASVFGKNHFSIYGKMQPNLELSQVNYDVFSTELLIREIL